MIYKRQLYLNFQTGHYEIDGTVYLFTDVIGLAPGITGPLVVDANGLLVNGTDPTHGSMPIGIGPFLAKVFAMLNAGGFTINIQFSTQQGPHDLMTIVDAPSNEIITTSYVDGAPGSAFLNAGGFPDSDVLTVPAPGQFQLVNVAWLFQSNLLQGLSVAGAAAQTLDWTGGPAGAPGSLDLTGTAFPPQAHHIQFIGLYPPMPPSLLPGISASAFPPVFVGQTPQARMIPSPLPSVPCCHSLMPICDCPH